MRAYSFIGVTIILVFVLNQSAGQSDYRVKHFTVADGLATRNVLAVTQDSLGFLWVATNKGFMRYDGSDFTFFYEELNDSLNILPKMPLATDDEGVLWMANANRAVLYRFDCRLEKFVTYLPKLGEGVMRSLARGKGDSIAWIGTRGAGLFRFNLLTGATKQFVNPTIDPRAPNPNNFSRTVNFIYAIKDLGDHLLIGSGRGLWKFVKATGTFEPAIIQGYAATYEKFPIWADYPQVVQIHSFGDHYWMKLNEQTVVTLVKVTAQDLTLLRKFNVPERYYENVNYNPMTVDKNETFWFKSRMGLTRYDSRNERIDVIDSTIRITEVFSDRDQNIWVANNSGLHRFSKSNLRFFNYPFDDPDKEGHQVLLSGLEWVKENGDDYIVASTDGGGIRTAHWSGPGDLRFKSLTIPRGSKHLQWISAIEKRESGLYVASFHDDVEEQHLFPLDIDFKNNSVVSQGAPFRVVQTQNSRPDLAPDKGIIWSIREDHDKDLVMRTSTGLIGGWNYSTVLRMVLRDGKRDTVIAYAHDPKDPATLSGFVIATHPESDSSFWVVTDGGLDLMVKNRIRHISKMETNWIQGLRQGGWLVGTQEGIFACDYKEGDYQIGNQPIIKINSSTALLEDKRGRYWIATAEQGLYCYDVHSGTLHHFTSEDGLGHNEFSFRLNNQTLQSPEGIMVLGRPKGLTLFDPLEFMPDTIVRSPLITKAIINNTMLGKYELSSAGGQFKLPESIHTLDELELDHRHNIVSLEFAAMEFYDQAKNLYSYKLEGFDPDWMNVDWRSRKATYTNLDAGTYRFRVRASNHHGVWSDQERTLKVIILPPPWRTWWAYTGYWLLGAGLLVLARRTVVQRERLKANLALEHLELEKAKEVDRVKTSFFTNISHEFRTPLTLIKGPVQEMLEQFKDDAKVQQRLKLVQRNSDLLLKLINQLLDLAKLESGTLKVEKSEADVNSFVRAIASSFESMARQKGLTINVDVPNDVRAALFDKDKVETILINLINNAIKFTPSGGTVSVKIEAGTSQQPTANSQKLSLVVSDTGIGIPPEHQSKIFERFHQVSESHKEVGTGIGLALVKELVNLMGGTITVDSEPGKGSTFTMIIPVESAASDKLQAASQFDQVEAEQRAGQETEAPSAQRLVPSANGSEDGSPSKPQVLVVEDNADLRAFIIDSLGSEFHFHQAENGKQGLQIATEQIPDMIISDVMMPEMDGMEMTRRIKEDIKTSHIPLILLTAKSGEDSKLEGLSKGADDYLTKPFNKQELLLKVRNGTARMQKLREKLKEEVLSSTPQLEVMSADEKFLNKVKETIIERMSDEQLSVESLADDIGMSRVQLYRKVSALTGMAVNELIRKLRLQRAAQLLSQNWGPVSQVAYEVGFSNLSYFSKVFKEEFNVLPSEYQKA